MIKLFPKESADELYDAVIAVVWVLGVLAAGTAAIWLIGYLVSVSVQTPLGIGGAVGVVVLAAGVGATVYIRKRRRRQNGASRPAARSGQSSKSDSVTPVVERVVRPHRPAPPEASETVARPVEVLNPHNPDDVFHLKRQLADAVEAGDFGKAETILQRIEEADGQREWCQVQRQAIQLKRRRSG